MVIIENDVRVIVYRKTPYSWYYEIFQKLETGLLYKSNGNVRDINERLEK